MWHMAFEKLWFRRHVRPCHLDFFKSNSWLSSGRRWENDFGHSCGCFHDGVTYIYIYVNNLKRLGTFQPPNVCRSCLSQLFFPAIAMDVTIGAKYDKSMDSLDQCRRSQLRSGSLMKSKKNWLVYLLYEM